MSWLIKTIIKIYWYLIPAKFRSRCIFRTSCSNHVYETTEKHGWLKGLIAFKYRFKACRPGYEVFYLDKENAILLLLPNGETIAEDEISHEILCKYKGL